MTIEFFCPNEHQLSAPDNMAGKAGKCPKCGGDLSPRKGRFKAFFGCTNYPKCDFTSWDKPVPQSCPKCKNPYLVEKTRKPRGKEPIQVLLCPACKHEEPLG